MNASHSWTDYQERLGRVIAYVHDHLDEPLDLDRLADVAHLSSFHWHRVYHALHGETLAATVRRLRLHRATGYLANTAMPVAQVARRCGYPNAQSFARAFKGLYGMNPLQYRQHGGHTAFQSGSVVEAPSGYTVALRHIPRVRLAGLDHHGSYMGVGKAFESAYVRLAALGQVTPATRWMAVYLDDPFAVPERQLHSRAGLSVPEGFHVEAPLVAFELGGQQQDGAQGLQASDQQGDGGGLCAVLRHQGPYATMRAAYQWLYGEWLVRSGHQVADSPVFEEYLNNPRDTAPADLLTDIYLPLLG